MSSFHEQWMAAWEELRDCLPVLQPVEYHALRADLSVARDLISEENDSGTRRSGGAVIREVRRHLREVRSAA